MDKREDTVSQTQKLLSEAGFATSDPRDLVHAGFDIVARKRDLILIIKVLGNANSINDGVLAGMMTLAKTVGGVPILIAWKSGRDNVEDGVMYSRSRIPLLSPQTFYDLIIEGVPPMVYAASGGYYVNVDSDMLRKVREGGLSLGDLADMGGVSRRTIRMYEDGMNAKLDVAMRLEQRLGLELILPVDPLHWEPAKQADEGGGMGDGLAKDIFLKLHQIGYSVDVAVKCPFDAVTHDNSVILFTGIDQKQPGLDKRARAISSLSKVLEKHSVIFVDRLGERVNIGGAPLIDCGELRKASDKKRIMDLIEERV